MDLQDLYFLESTIVKQTQYSKAILRMITNKNTSKVNQLLVMQCLSHT